jgi:aspartate carbamoyltransferase catalytic subunit
MQKSLCSITDLSKDEMLQIMRRADDFKKELAAKGKTEPLLTGKIIGTLFFEPSTRTQESFKSAAHRLGAKTQGFAQSAGTSLEKGESFYDTVMTMSRYCDLLVIRTPWAGSQSAISEKINIPLINAGDGANQHPSQTMLDLYSIQETQGHLDGLAITIVGDLKYGRTVHSLVRAMTNWNTRFNFVSPAGLELPPEDKAFLREKNLEFIETRDMAAAVRDADIVYMTRIQRERFADQMEYERARGTYVFNNSMLEGTRDNLRILHPLPRVNEIHPEVDSDPKAYYFDQAENGVYTRMALLCHLLDKG